MKCMMTIMLGVVIGFAGFAPAQSAASDEQRFFGNNCVAHVASDGTKQVILKLAQFNGNNNPHYNDKESGWGRTFKIMTSMPTDKELEGSCIIDVPVPMNQAFSGPNIGTHVVISCAGQSYNLIGTVNVRRNTVLLKTTEGDGENRRTLQKFFDQLTALDKNKSNPSFSVTVKDASLHLEYNASGFAEAMEYLKNK